MSGFQRIRALSASAGLIVLGTVLYVPVSVVLVATALVGKRSNDF